MQANSVATESKPVAIEPVGNAENRPFWSVMIPTYNFAKYLVKTLQSVLDQDPGPDRMQIEVVDDVSTKDDPEAVVREVGGAGAVFPATARWRSHGRTLIRA